MVLIDHIGEKPRNRDKVIVEWNRFLVSEARGVGKYACNWGTGLIFGILEKIKILFDT